MKNVDELITVFSSKFNGGSIDEIQAKKLRERFSSISYFDNLIKLLQGINLVNLEFELGPNMDMSGVGANMEIMSPSDQIEEAFEFYPGIAAIKKEFIPFATCLSGSGDPYFVNIKSDEIFIFRIPHNSVLENDKIDENKIEIVISIEALLNI